MTDDRILTMYREALANAREQREPEGWRIAVDKHDLEDLLDCWARMIAKRENAKHELMKVGWPV